MNNKSYFYKIGKEDRYVVRDEIDYKLYVVDDDGFMVYKQEVKDVIYALKGKVINNVPLIGRFCNKKCVLKDVIINKDTIEYKFMFERESFKYRDNVPIKVIDEFFIQCRYYFKKKLAVVVPAFETEVSSVMGIICTMGKYVSLEQSRGFNFTYSTPKYKELLLENDKISLIQNFLDGRILLSDLEVEGSNLPCFSVNYLYKSDCLECTTLKASISKGKNKILTFYNKYLKEQKLVISNNGIISSTVVLEEKTFDEIIKVIYFVFKNETAKEFLMPIDPVIYKYCEYIHKDMTFEGKELQKKLIYNELCTFVKSNFPNNDVGIIYLTIVFNIIIKIFNEKKVLKDSNKERFFNRALLELLDYDNLIKFLYVYSNKICGITMSQGEIEDIILRAGAILKTATGEEESLINFYKNL